MEFLFDDELKMSPEFPVVPGRVRGLAVGFVEKVRPLALRIAVGIVQAEQGVGPVWQRISVVKLLPDGVAVCVEALVGESRRFDLVPQGCSLAPRS